ncbi:MAG: nicotinate phosphoribosyltransferase [Spirochaetia bacterium]|nr:nicotinate phosphoribosyltransferase [Spirochaetia bacterium]
MTSALFTDFYELTMAQGFFKGGADRPAVFEMFFRRQPWHGGYSVFAGLEPLLEDLEAFRFGDEDLAWLEAQGAFAKDFLDFLAAFRFRGTVDAAREGELVFPQEPLVRVSGGIVECALVEGLILNRLNYQSLVATKTARLKLAAKGAGIMEFGLRRAQGPDGALSASRAAYVGGAAGTSNALAARTFGIPAMGTMAHSWIMAFPDELSAFEAYAALYPDRSVFLVDTYDTLGSGVPNAIKVGRRLAAEGRRFGIRLDSGDIQYLSIRAREALDAAGLRDAYIVVSNELDEEIVEHLVAEGAPVDTWGVGTNLVTGGSESSFTGVYKLAARAGEDGRLEPVMKFSDVPEKATNPGVKDVWRLYDERGMAKADVLAPEGEGIPTGVEQTFHHPALDARRFAWTPCCEARPLLRRVMTEGRREAAGGGLEDARRVLDAELARFDATYLRLLNPHAYKVALTQSVHDLKLSFFERYRKFRT